MPKPQFVIAALLLAALPVRAQSTGPDAWGTQRLWYPAPATRWEEGLPIGNGRLGAMVLGGPAEERLALNEETLLGVRNPAHSNYGTDYFRMDGLAPDTLRLTGKSSTYLGIEGRLRYEARMVARVAGGTREVDYRTLRVRGADEAVLILAAATNFIRYNDVSADVAARVAATLRAVAARSWDAMLMAHVAEHRSWFRRVSLALGPDTATAPLDVRLRRYAQAPDPSLAALVYQFGRYVLIASSRPGTQPANLQGIWNDNPNPWWDSKYTININTPMNYWLAEPAGLPELTGPLFGLIKDVSETGGSVAREHWNARGWVLHQNTDLWRAPAPMDGPSWGVWPIGGAWLTLHLFDHWRYAPDEAFLAEWYPVIRDQARFLADILVEHPTRGWLVINPGMSPENFPGFPGNGRFFDETSGSWLDGRMMSAGVTMDNRVIRALFDAFLQSAARLGLDSAMRREIAAKRTRLPPNQIGKHGQLQEWLDDWDELEPQHRHLSHLWGLYPGEEVTPQTTPPLAAAAAVSLERRGPGGCGWSMAWKVALWARLARPAEAHRQLAVYLSENELPNLFSRCGRALQVDGTLGMSAAIGEMLLQSRPDTLDLLPALPAEWPAGQFTGLRARGGLTVDLTWSAGRATEVVIRASRGGRVVVRGGPGGPVTADGRRVRSRSLGAGSVEFVAAIGRNYRLRQ